MEVFILFAFGAFMVGIGFYYAKKAQANPESYYLSNRNNGVAVITAGHVMGWVGAGTLVGVYGTGYARGLGAAIWYPVGFSLSFFFYAFVLAKRLKRMGDRRGCYTLSEIFDKRLGKSVSLTFSVLSILKNCNYFAGQMVAISVLLEMFIGIPLVFGLLIATVIVWIYVGLGGLSATLMTTFWQLTFTLVGLLLAVGVGLRELGGWGNMMAALPPDWSINPFEGRSALALSGLVLPTFFSCFSNITMPLRTFSCRDERTAFMACIWSGVIAFAMVGLTCIGIFIVRAYLPDLERGDYALFEMFRRVLPIGGAFFAASVMSACMSTADECLIAPTATFARDIYKAVFNKNADDRKIMVVSQIFMVFYCGLAFFLAWQAKSVLDLMVYAANMLSCSVPVFIGIWFWKRMNAPGAVTGLITGGLTAVVWMFSPSLREIMPALWAGIIVTTITMIPVTLMTAPPTEEQLEYIAAAEENYVEKPVAAA